MGTMALTEMYPHCWNYGLNVSVGGSGNKISQGTFPPQVPKAYSSGSVWGPALCVCVWSLAETLVQRVVTSAPWW